ncbi:DUF6988 family protein [Pseudomonas sp. DC3000-4b1]|uniref:DUF6988 family protein n=1 Tax=unclassified Pseudomonas TaxID=196821 RepID=UPI003CFAA7D7
MQPQVFQHHPDLKALLNKSEKWMFESYQLAGTGGLDTDDKNLVGRVLWHLSIEHFQAIHILIDNGLFGSAYALLRPQFEGYVRGTWLHYCASPELQIKFTQGKEPPRFSEMLKAIKLIENFQEGELTEFSELMLKTLHDYTHGGAGQFWNRINDSGIDSNYEQKDVTQILKLSLHISYLAFIALAETANNVKLMNCLSNKYLETFDYIAPGA